MQEFTTVSGREGGGQQRFSRGLIFRGLIFRGLIFREFSEDQVLLPLIYTGNPRESGKNRVQVAVFGAGTSWEEGDRWEISMGIWWGYSAGNARLGETWASFLQSKRLRLGQWQKLG